LLGFDLDLTRVDDVIERGAVTTKTVDGKQLCNAHEVISLAGKDLGTILDRCLPIDRQRRAVLRKEFRVLETATARQHFQRQWSRLHRHVSRLIADPEEDLSHRELRLIHQLMQASHFYSRFDLGFTSAELQRVTGLDDEYLPKARRRLEHLGVLRSERNGTTGWILTLLDPKTAMPFKTTEEIANILPADDWTSWDQC
jgi:hypothetical protein